MMVSKVFDCAVIGAGMFGSAAAKYLSEQGADVIVIGPAEPQIGDAVDQRTFSAHFDEARIARRLGWDTVWGTFDSRSLNRFRDIEAQSGSTIFHECGSLLLLPESIAHRTDAMLSGHGESTSVVRFSSTALAKSFPYLGFPLLEGEEGLFEPTMAGYVNPRQLVGAQLCLAHRAGAVLLRATVVGITKEKLSHVWRLDVSHGDGIGAVLAANVLVATGAFTNHNDVLPADCRLVLRAFAEPNLLFEIGRRDLERFRSMPPVVIVDPADIGDDNMSIYLLPPIQYPDGKWYVRIGPGMQPLVHELDTVEQMIGWYARQTITERQRGFLTRMCELLLPELTPLSIRQACCIIEKTPSRYPYIGPVGEDSSLSVVVGGNGHGARGSDEIGRLAAGIVLGNDWEFPIDQNVFTPMLASGASEDTYHSGYLKPPFGLC